MEEKTLNNRVVQMLNELDTIEDIQPSADWNHALMNKLYASKYSLRLVSPSVKLVIMVLFILLINVGYIISTMIFSPKHDILRNKELQVISKEFLINPTSINN